MTGSLWSNRRGRVALALAGVLILLAGCDKKAQPTGTVSGRLTLEGQPFSEARLNFLSKETGAAFSVDIEGNGSFKIDTPVRVGKYTVFLTPRTMPDPDHPAPSGKLDKSIPEKYSSEATSDLVVEIKEGPNDLTIPLQK